MLAADDCCCGGGVWYRARRTEEVRNGCFVPYEGANAQVKQGVNLGVVKAANKGAVGLGFRCVR
jgi:hypothetical protein